MLKEFAENMPELTEEDRSNFKLLFGKPKDELIMSQSHVQDLKSELNKLSEALNLIYSHNGEDEEISKIYHSVETIVSNYS